MTQPPNMVKALLDAFAEARYGKPDHSLIPFADFQALLDAAPAHLEAILAGQKHLREHGTLEPRA